MLQAPDWWWWYQELKSWQSGIAAIIALFALLGGALYNFRLNRRRDDALHREEMLAVATAIYGEILLLRERLALLARILSQHYNNQDKEIDDQFVNDYIPNNPKLYPALAPKIGLLSHDLVLDITRFYDNYQTAKDNLPLLVKSDSRPVPDHVVTVLRPAVDAIYDVRTALRKIEQLAGIPKAKDPASGLADPIVSFFDDEIRRQKEQEQRRWMTPSISSNP
jgi:hypothetical protein